MPSIIIAPLPFLLMKSLISPYMADTLVGEYAPSTYSVVMSFISVFCSLYFASAACFVVLVKHKPLPYRFRLFWSVSNAVAAPFSFMMRIWSSFGAATSFPAFFSFFSFITILSLSAFAFLTSALMSSIAASFFSLAFGFLPSFSHAFFVFGSRLSRYTSTIVKFPLPSFSFASFSSISMSNASIFISLSWLIWSEISSIFSLNWLYFCSSSSLSLVTLCRIGLNEIKYALPSLYSAFSSIPVPAEAFIIDADTGSPYFSLIRSRSPSSLVLICICVAIFALTSPTKSVSTCEIRTSPMPHFLNSLAALSSCTSPSPEPPNFVSSLCTSSNTSSILSFGLSSRFATNTLLIVLATKTSMSFGVSLFSASIVILPGSASPFMSTNSLGSVICLMLPL